MSVREIACPDIGGFKDVAVIDVLVKPGDVIALEAPLVTLETDKATMDVPASIAGRVVEVLVTKASKVSQGTLLVRVEAEGAGAAPTAAPATAAAPASPALTSTSMTATSLNPPMSGQAISRTLTARPRAAPARWRGWRPARC